MKNYTIGVFYFGFILTTAAAVLGGVYPDSWWGAIWMQETTSADPLEMAICMLVALIWGVCAIFVAAHIISMFIPYSLVVKVLSPIGAFVGFVIVLSAEASPEEAEVLARIAAAHIGGVAATTVILIASGLCLLLWLSQLMQSPVKGKRGERE